jgi:hypothetical protein
MCLSDGTKIHALFVTFSAKIPNTVVANLPPSKTGAARFRSFRSRLTGTFIPSSLACAFRMIRFITRESELCVTSSIWTGQVLSAYIHN